MAEDTVLKTMTKNKEEEKEVEILANQVEVRKTSMKLAAILDRVA